MVAAWYATWLDTIFRAAPLTRFMLFFTAESLSESDGYFSYLGLTPGSYTVRLDENQLENLSYQASTLSHDIIIRVSVDGDIVNKLDFLIKSKDEAH